MPWKVFAVLLIAGFCLCFSPSASATPNWTSGEFTTGERELATKRDCTTSIVSIYGSDPANPSEAEQAPLCVYELKNWRRALYVKETPNWWGGSTTTRYNVISVGLDQGFYVVDNMGWGQEFLSSPHSDTLYVKPKNRLQSGLRLYSYADFFRSIVFDAATKRYDAATVERRLVLEAETGASLYPNAVGMSANGRFMAIEANGDGLLLLDTATGQLRGFSNYRHNYGVGRDASIRFVVSDDGRHVGMFHFNITNKLYTLDDSCVVTAQAYTPAFESALRSMQDCPHDNGRMNAALEAHYNDGWAERKVATRFSDDGQVLYFEELVDDPTAPGGQRAYDLPLRASNYQPTSRLDYLALGDSYSSGEGDFSIFGNYDRYVPFTDEIGPPKENCHVSKTSYPFLLRDAYGISVDKMQSVACSGAKTTDIVANKADYLGQNNRLEDVDNIETYRSEALRDFIPGRVPQIDFVKKYQPKVITVGIGGNDSDFAPTLSKCVSRPLDECDEASGLNGHRERVGKLIMNNFSKLRHLYYQLHLASPDSKIYAVGYPQFIADSAAPCLLNGAFVSKSERQFINEAVKQMNTVIKNAAMTSGVTYIDIEDSLDGGKLCEGISSDYVTGVRNQFYLSGFSENLRTFLYHPNSEGHQKIAESIHSKIEDIFAEADPDDDVDTVPSYSDYFSSSETYTSYVQSDKTIITAVPTRGEPLTASFEPSTYGYETITVSMFSAPRELGTVMPQADGSLEYTFIIPNDIELGYHTLLFKGVSYSREPLEIVQTIFVRNNDPNDIDGDGISDVDDLCIFDAICDTLPDEPEPKADAPTKAAPSSRVFLPEINPSESTGSLVIGAIVASQNGPSNTVDWLEDDTPPPDFLQLGDKLTSNNPAAIVAANGAKDAINWKWLAAMVLAIILIVILKVRLYAKS